MADTNLRKQIGKHLQELRRENGFSSAREYAERLGISASKYTEYEQGRTPLPMEVAWLIADDFNITLDELGGRTPPAHDSETLVLIDEDQREINQSYLAMNDEGKETLVRVAKSLRRDQVNQTVKDGQDNQASSALGA